MGMVDAFLVVVRAALVSRARLAVENPALRQQLAVLKRSVKRPRLRPRDRLFWAWLSRVWTEWHSRGVQEFERSVNLTSPAVCDV